jgi:hypothetical protein
MSRTRTSRRRTAVASTTAVAVLLAGATLTACAGVHRAIDCAKTAASIAGDVQDLQNSATNVGQVSDASRRKDTVNALDKVDRDLKKLGGKKRGSDVDKAVDDLDTAVHNARTAADEGRTPDLKPVGSAASHLTGVCAKG